MNRSTAGLKGVECRRARAELKRELKAGTRRVSEVLFEPTLPHCLQTMALHELLEAVPHLTPRLYEPMLEAVPIKLTALCSDPTYRKRRELIKRLEAWERRKDRPEPKDGRGRTVTSHMHRLSGAGARILVGKEGG